MAVLQFPKKSQDVKRSLRELYAQAERNEIEGICWLVHKGAGSHESGISGTYRQRPNKALAAIVKATAALYAYAVRKEVDPLTATDVMGGMR